MKTWDYPDLREKSEGKNLTKKFSRSSARSNWKALLIDNALSCAVFQGNCEGGKSHALSNKPTLYRQGLHSATTPMYVSGFITAVQMIRNVFSERSFVVQLLPGVCTDQIQHTLSWHLKEKTTAMWLTCVAGGMASANEIKFWRRSRQSERRSREKGFQSPSPHSPRGFAARLSAPPLNFINPASYAGYNVTRDWGETWGMKFDTKYSCKMSQVTHCHAINRLSWWFASKKAKKCSACVQYMGKR